MILNDFGVAYMYMANDITAHIYTEMNESSYYNEIELKKKVFVNGFFFHIQKCT